MIYWLCADGVFRFAHEILEKWPDIARRQTQDPKDERYSHVELLDVQNGGRVVASARAFTQEIDTQCDSIPLIEDVSGEPIDPETRFEITDTGSAPSTNSTDA